ncbi:hypothetical protein [Maribellus sp. YY47]|uniref:hypothetical protein n=1 Tax=Maribellus sp. YY47 TaxID=2929486 RepID=UPI002001A00C|nr:hypothetical protein [Maribellus sp. YY47]MCK3684379.1 hypothetical protein [Maribellus sp. YY47]
MNNQMKQSSSTVNEMLTEQTQSERTTCENMLRGKNDRFTQLHGEDTQLIWGFVDKRLEVRLLFSKNSRGYEIRWKEKFLFGSVVREVYIDCTSNSPEEFMLAATLELNKALSKYNISKQQVLLELKDLTKDIQESDYKNEKKEESEVKSENPNQNSLLKNYLG